MTTSSDEKAVGVGEEAPGLGSPNGGSLKGEDILALQDLDPALNMKMYLVNNVRSP